MREPVIIRSGECSVDWLCTTLPLRWFGGEHVPEWRPGAGDVLLRHFRWDMWKLEQVPCVEELS